MSFFNLILKYVGTPEDAHPVNPFKHFWLTIRMNLQLYPRANIDHFKVKRQKKKKKDPPCLFTISINIFHVFE